MPNPYRSVIRHIFCALACVATTSGCAQLPAPQARPVSRALSVETAASTSLAKIARASAPGPGVSGFRLLVSGEAALDTLIALADHAERTLDLQYYLIRSDGSSRAIMQHVRAAADRGVRVRLLLDDLNTAGQDEGLMRLTMHPHIEVRLYNPLPAGRFSIGSRILASLTDIKRINHRMHNKMFVADNTLAVTGGRNLGDPYFLRGKDSNFVDIDVLAAGPVVHSLSTTFDRFWNDPLAYPVTAVASASASAGSAPASATAAVISGEAPAAPRPDDHADDIARQLSQGRLQLSWVAAHVVADKPSKLEAGNEPVPSEVMDDDIQRLLASTRHQLVIISPYFVPGPHGMAVFAKLRARGVEVSVLTNSLATTDAPAVHIGYAKYRKPLLKMGVKLFELKPDLGTPKKSAIGSLGSSRASLHAKVIVVDGEVAVVGSMNLDPRSRDLNSEMGVFMRSPALAKQLLNVFDEVSQDSYALSLSPDEELQWQTHTPDPALAGEYEPGASTWLKLGLKLLKPFAPEEML